MTGRKDGFQQPTGSEGTWLVETQPLRAQPQGEQVADRTPADSPASEHTSKTNASDAASASASESAWLVETQPLRAQPPQGQAAERTPTRTDSSASGHPSETDAGDAASAHVPPRVRTSPQRKAARRRRAKRKQPLPNFGGGIRGQFLRVSGLGGFLRSTRQGLSSQALTRLRRRTILWAALFLVLLGVFSGVFDAVHRVSQASAEARDAVAHLRAIESLIPSQDNLGQLLDPGTLQKLQQELTAAQRDFALLRNDLDNPGGTFFIAAHTPVVHSTFGSMRALVDAASEASIAGLELVKSAQTVNSVLKAGFFASSSTSDSGSSNGTNATSGSGSPGSGTPPAAPLNAAMLAQLQHNINDAFQHLTLAVSDAQSADLSMIPSSILKPKQVEQVHQLLANWPQIQKNFAVFETVLNAAPELLGVTAPENFLLELMDRSELRATGGFIGNYAIMSIQNGQIQPFSLSDVYLLDIPFKNKTNLPAPAAYPWWPFDGFGLRDSNLSANFPTSAQLGMSMLSQEGGPSVQGVIAFTPPALARVIQIIGPIYVPDFNETVTDQNLEQLIHYYQQTLKNDPVTDLPPDDQISSPRKRFTALLARAFIEKLHGLPSSELGKIVKATITSLQTKDIQVYLTNKNVEAILAQNHIDGSITQGPGDGVTVVDDNIGANKGSQFTTVSYTDNVTLDAQGTATHDLTITYNFKVTDPSVLFGADIYATYLRIYAPSNAQLTSVEGFGPQGASDEPGRQMWGGIVKVADGKPYTIHIVWSVPKAATSDKAGHWSYRLVFQHQSGSNQQLALTVTTPGAKAPAVSYNGVLDMDKTYTVNYRL